MSEGATAQPTWRRYDLADPDQRAVGLADAARAVACGRCIVLPTDTVYGIGANPFSARAVQGLLEAKHRGRDMPPPVLIAEPAMLGALVASIPQPVTELVKAFWPGALTIILRVQQALVMDLGETRDTIAVRVPDDEATREFLRYTGPLAVSSANISSSPAARTVDEAIEMLGESVEVYLDGGVSPGQTASTIVDYASTEQGRIVRSGVLSHAQLVEVAAGLVDLVEEPGAKSSAQTETSSSGTPEPATESPRDDPAAMG